jgi:hypothetical protein
MRGRLLPTLLAVLTMLVLGAGEVPATAAAGWRVTPGGPFAGSGGPVSLPGVTCGSSRITGRFISSGTALGVIDGITYQNCSGFLTVAVTAQGSWPMVPTSYSSGVTTINVTNIAAYVSGPGCTYQVAGQAATSFDNLTSILTVHSESSTVTSGSCLGLVSPGQHTTILSRSYAISPRQVIEPA